MTTIIFDGSTNPGTVVIEHAGLSFRARFDGDAEAKEAAHALRQIVAENARLKEQARSVRAQVEALAKAVTP